jgi:hypothetical protein
MIERNSAAVMMLLASVEKRRGASLSLSLYLVLCVCVCVCVEGGGKRWTSGEASVCAAWVLLRQATNYAHARTTRKRLVTLLAISVLILRNSSSFILGINPRPPSVGSPVTAGTKERTETHELLKLHTAMNNTN